MTVQSRGRRSPIEISTKSVVVSPWVLGEDTLFFFRFLTSSVATWCKAARNLSQEEITLRPAWNVSGSPGAGRPAVEGGADCLLGELTKTVLRFQRESRIDHSSALIVVMAEMFLKNNLKQYLWRSYVLLLFQQLNRKQIYSKINSVIISHFKPL